MKGKRQVMAVFSQDEKTYAFPIGVQSGGDYRIYADEILYIQDPKELYKHWPPDVWGAIEKHEVKPAWTSCRPTSRSAWVFLRDRRTRVRRRSIIPMAESR